MSERLIAFNGVSDSEYFMRRSLFQKRIIHMKYYGVKTNLK